MWVDSVSSVKRPWFSPSGQENQRSGQDVGRRCGADEAVFGSAATGKHERSELFLINLILIKHGDRINHNLSRRLLHWEGGAL